jgi:hypothetical protein
VIEYGADHAAPPDEDGRDRPVRDSVRPCAAWVTTDDDGPVMIIADGADPGDRPPDHRYAEYRLYDESPVEANAVLDAHRWQRIGEWVRTRRGWRRPVAPGPLESDLGEAGSAGAAAQPVDVGEDDRPRLEPDPVARDEIGERLVDGLA